MFYVSFGMKKSGSTLAFELTRALLEKHGLPQRRIVHPRMPAVHKVNFIDINNMLALTKAEFESLEKLAGSTGVTVIKTHAPPSELMCELAKSGRIIGHANFRDPRDNILSLLDAGVRARKDPQNPPFAKISNWDDAEKACDRGIESLERWLQLPGFMVTNYSMVAFRSEEFLRRVSEQLSLPLLSESDYQRLVSRVKNQAFTQFNQGLDKRHRDELSIHQCLSLVKKYRKPILSYMEEDLDDLDLAFIATSERLPESKDHAAFGRMSGRRKLHMTGIIRRSRFAIHQIRRRLWP